MKQVDGPKAGAPLTKYLQDGQTRLAASSRYIVRISNRTMVKNVGIAVRADSVEILNEVLRI